MTHEKNEKIYNALLNETELLAKEGVSTVEMARVMATFLVTLTYDCAPSSDHATHLIMSAMMQRLEQNIGPLGDDY